MYHYALWIGIILLLLIAIVELWSPQWINEGFTTMMTVGESSLWANWMPRRGDVGLNPTEEEVGYHRDIRHVSGYTDVQRLGQDHDFCRMIMPVGDPESMFFACALGGTEGLSTVKYRTLAIKDGFQISRDDYMNAGYCRILKTSDGIFEAKCNPIGDNSFKPNIITDPNPPAPINMLLTFYEGIVFWLRFHDDLMDYAKNLTISTAGQMEIDEIPKPITEGLTFNGKDQFLRIGDSKDMSLGNLVPLNYLRAVSFWVYFDQFTNNAKIYDFGNGPGQDNVMCGIIGRGNETTQQTVIENKCIEEDKKTVPLSPSGAQCSLEQSPQTVLFSSSGDIDRWDCPMPEVFGRIMEPLHTKAAKKYTAQTADLLYEIWDHKQRKLHIQVKNVFPLHEWTHIVITTTNNDAFKPGLKIYRNGVLVHTEVSAFLPQTPTTTKNYIGKSNWANATSQDANADELFHGKLFDFRGYNLSMMEKKIQDTYSWGKERLDKEQSH